MIGDQRPKWIEDTRVMDDRGKAVHGRVYVSPTLSICMPERGHLQRDEFAFIIEL